MSSTVQDTTDRTGVFISRYDTALSGQRIRAFKPSDVRTLLEMATERWGDEFDITVETNRMVAQPLTRLESERRVRTSTGPK